MLFWYIRFALEWTIWLIFADKKRWRELLPVSFMAGLLGTTTDLITFYHPLWQYDGDISPIPRLLNTWGIYVVITYLFIQWLPSKRTFWRMFVYWFLWTGATIIFEWMHGYMGHMTYPLWWRMYHSYIADWILFTVFYQYYNIFKFERLR